MKRSTATLAVFLLILAGLAARPTARAADAEPGFTLKLLDAKKIWDSHPFNGFTDLIRFKDHWYLALREATGHVEWDGNIRLLRSADTTRWNSAAHILCPKGGQTDLRDPKLSITPQGQLMLTSAAYWPRETCQSYVWFSSDGATWSKPHPIGPAGTWMWRTEWHQGRAYNFGATRLAGNILQLYRSRDGIDFVKHGPEYLPGRNSNETAVVFALNGTCHVLLRQSPVAMLGVAKPPYTSFTWTDLNAPVGGPEMIMLPGGQLLAAVRLYDDGEYTALCWVDPKNSRLQKMLRLPSGGDTSYTGMVLDKDNLLRISYYSSHEGKTSVYFATVTIAFTEG